MSEVMQWYATGKRKSAIARVWMLPGNGNIVINKRPIDEYFGRATLKMILSEPFELTETIGKYDLKVNVCGGGLAGQAGAIRHGITRALLEVNPQFRSILKKVGLITRDSRVKERKKYGQPGARKRFQYSKR
ncbi:MAG: 30S ribosomal protein S9 [Deltaproteobacteria bacterium]|nr:30S ribosomal protein S9 [Deltaproteobacteria bacterium]MBW1870673.1 30S ribosomal protein S9 [Deltaproteobacteria bacterium]